MSTPSDARQFFRTVLRWRRGRQNSGYDKMLLLQSRWPLPFDLYLLRYPEDSHVPPHTDKVDFGSHYRLNLVVKKSGAGGEFHCAKPILSTDRIKLFRPDECEHSVSRMVGGSRYVLSLGWVLRARPR
jgi:hypothetical protein